MNKIYSFDFDDTIRMENDGSLNKPIIEIINKHVADGDECIIVTARNKTFFHVSGVDGYLLKHSIPIKTVYFTNHELKGPLLKSLGVDIHYDDKEDHLDSALRCKVKAFKVRGEEIIEYSETSIERMLRKIKG